MVAVLGKVPLHTLGHVSAAGIAILILTCYTLAVKEGHVPIWLPSISSCGDYPPEKYIFTYGMVVIACMLVLEALCVYGGNKPFSGSIPILVTSTVAAFCLGTLGTICSICEWRVHLVASYIFFILEDVFMILISTYSWGHLSTVSFTFKTACAVGGTLCTALKLFSHLQALSHPEVRILSNILEWSNAAIFIVFHWNLAFDYTGFYLAEVDTNTEQLKAEVERGEKRPPV